MVPNIFHFVFGMAADFGGKPFGLVHFLSVKSAVELNKPATAFFHYEFEPYGEWWDRAKPMLTLNKIKSPETFMGNQINHFAHKADIIRLQVLKEQGGIYLDLDTICVKPMKELLNCSFAIGRELKAVHVPKNWRQKIKNTLRSKNSFADEKSSVSAGLCNGVLLAEKNSDFINYWLMEYKNFRSAGIDKYWNEHSVFVPLKLANAYPAIVTKLSPYAFHFPLYDGRGLESMFERVTEFPEAFLHHLWESFSWDKYLSKLTVDEIMNHNTTYNLIARKYL